jgi:hypothetical protein
LGLLQMTITTPWRRMILQRSQRALTDAETFTLSANLSSHSIGDPAAREVVGRQLDADPIPGQDADEVHPQLAADVGQDAVLVIQLDGEHGVGKRLDDRSFNLDSILLGHRRRQAPSVVGSMVDEVRGAPDGAGRETHGDTGRCPMHERGVYQVPARLGKAPVVAVVGQFETGSGLTG